MEKQRERTFGEGGIPLWIERTGRGRLSFVRASSQVISECTTAENPSLTAPSLCAGPLQERALDAAIVFMETPLMAALGSALDRVEQEGIAAVSQDVWEGLKKGAAR
jgi:hypothetical protein